MYLVVEAMKGDPVRVDPYTWHLRRLPSHRDIGTTKKLSVLRLYEQELRVRGMMASVAPVVGLSLYGLALSLLVGPWLSAMGDLWRAKAGTEWGTMLFHTAAALVAVVVPLVAAGAPFLVSASVWRYRRRLDMLSERVNETIRLRLEETRFSE